MLHFRPGSRGVAAGGGGGGANGVEGGAGTGTGQKLVLKFNVINLHVLIVCDIIGDNHTVHK